MGDGHINAFDPGTGDFLGTLSDTLGNPIKNDGLWGLTFGNGGNGGDPNILYFTAGLNNGADGLLGSLAPLPGSLLLLGSGLFSICWEFHTGEIDNLQERIIMSLFRPVGRFNNYSG